MSDSVICIYGLVMKNVHIYYPKIVLNIINIICMIDMILMHIYNIYYMDDIIVMIYTIVFDRYARYGT